MALVRAAADGARRYLARPDIFHLHGVAGAMAVFSRSPDLMQTASMDVSPNGGKVTG